MKSAWAAREVLGRTEQSLDHSLRSVWSRPVLEGLDRKLAAFEDALAAFQWPADRTPWFQARLVTGTDESRGKISATVRPVKDATPEAKAVSGGFDASAPATVPAGSYRFALSLGNSTETLSVDVHAGDTWGNVLGAVQSAVNAAPLAVRADVVRQNFPYQMNADLAGTGSMLTLSVNPDRPDQDLRLSDVSGTLVSKLGLTAVGNPSGPARQTQYLVSGLQQALPTAFSSTPVDPRAATALALGRHDLAWSVSTVPQPSAYISAAFDPTQATTLAPGTYTFSSRYGDETRSHAVTIGSGWTWNDVLQAVSGELNGQPVYVNPVSPTLAATTSSFSQPGVSASVTSWPIPSTTQRGVSTDGQSLSVTGAAGQDFTLSDASGGLLSALGLTTRLKGTPVSFNVQAGDTWQDVYDTMSAAIGGAQRYFTVTAVPASIPSSVTPGGNVWHEGVYLALIQRSQRIGERVDLSDGRTGVLAAMGIIAREQPGQDGKISVDGREQVSENNTFSLDQGRVLLRLEQGFAAPLPLSVTSGIDQVEKGWTGITDAWNGLAKYLKNNSDLLDRSLGARLEAPLAAQASNLGWLGVSSTGKSGQLWTSLDGFWKSLSADADRAKATLWAPPAGLVPAWREAVAGVRRDGQDNWLKPETSFDAHRPTLTSELQLEQKHRLIKLLG